MTLFTGGILEYAIVVFLILVFAEYVKVRSKVDKQLNFLVAGVIWLLLAWTFSGLTFWGLIGDVGTYGAYLFEFLGWLLILIGALWAGIKLVME
jgi:hypothetical protein